MAMEAGQSNSCCFDYKRKLNPKNKEPTMGRGTGTTKQSNVKPNNVTTLPATLSWKRAVTVTDARLTCIDSSQQQAEDLFSRLKNSSPIDLRQQGQRTTASYSERAKTSKNSVKGEDSRNLTYGDEAMLPDGMDTLLVSFSGAVLPVSEMLAQCDDSFVAGRLVGEIVPSLLDKAVEHVANCYAYNICSGNFLWRNREDALSVRIEVEYGTPENTHMGRVVVANAKHMPKHPVITADPNATGIQANHHYKTYGKKIQGFSEFSDFLAKAFSGQLQERESGISAAPAVFRVVAACTMLPLAHVWPSQLYLPGAQKVPKTEQPISRIFYKIGETPRMTSVKIGNALRQYDCSHNNSDCSDSIIAIEPKGGSLMTGLNLRSENNSFYSYLKKMLSQVDEQNPKQAILNWLNQKVSEEEAGYILGVFIRGGVFGEKAKSEAGKDEKSSTDNSETTSGAVGESVESVQ